MYYNMNSYKSSSGRVDIINKTQSPDISSNLFAMYDKIPANQCATFREPTLGQWDETTIYLKHTFLKKIYKLFKMGSDPEFMKNQMEQYISCSSRL